MLIKLIKLISIVVIAMLVFSPALAASQSLQDTRFQKAPTLEALAREQSESLKIVKVNVDENPGLSGKYGVMSIQTMLVFSGGREADRRVGALPDKALRTRVARWVQTGRQTTWYILN